MEARITLECGDEKTAKAIANAVSPENCKTPVGLSIETFRNNSKVVTEIISKGKLSTFIATIDDLLFSASTAQKAICIVKEGK